MNSDSGKHPPRTHHDARREEDAARHSVFNEPGAIFPDGSPAHRRGVIDRDWSCETCGYNLRGLDADAPCPECAHRQIHVPPHERGGYGALLHERSLAPRPAWVLGMLVLIPAFLSLFAVPIIGLLEFTPESVNRIVLVPIATAFIVIGPLVMTVERRPWRLRSTGEIMIVAGTAAALYAAAEHAITIIFFKPDMEVAGYLLRATFGMAIPIACMLYAASGLAAVWHRAMTEGREPDLTPFYPRFMIAITAYAVYKSLLVMVALTGHVV